MINYYYPTQDRGIGYLPLPTPSGSPSRNYATSQHTYAVPYSSGYRSGTDVAANGGVDGITGAAVNHGMTDITAAFDRQLAETYYNFVYMALDATFTEKMDIMLTYMSTGAPYDFKNRPSSAFHRDNMGEFGVYRGQKMAPDDFGNYNYGMAAKALGLSEWFSVGIVGAFPNSVRTWWNVAGGFDQIKDTRMIRAGYNHEW